MNTERKYETSESSSMSEDNRTSKHVLFEHSDDECMPTPMICLKDIVSYDSSTDDDIVKVSSSDDDKNPMLRHVLRFEDSSSEDESESLADIIRRYGKFNVPVLSRGSIEDLSNKSLVRTTCTKCEHSMTMRFSMLLADQVTCRRCYGEGCYQKSQLQTQFDKKFGKHYNVILPKANKIYPSQHAKLGCHQCQWRQTSRITDWERMSYKPKCPGCIRLNQAPTNVERKFKEIEKEEKVAITRYDDPKGGFEVEGMGVVDGYAEKNNTVYSAIVTTTDGHLRANATVQRLEYQRKRELQRKRIIRKASHISQLIKV